MHFCMPETVVAALWLKRRIYFNNDMPKNDMIENLEVGQKRALQLHRLHQ